MQPKLACCASLAVVSDSITATAATDLQACILACLQRQQGHMLSEGLEHFTEHKPRHPQPLSTLMS